MFLLRGYVNYQYSFFFDSGKLAKKCDPLRRVHRGSSASLKKRDYFGNMQGSEARITRADLDLQRQKMKSGSDLVGSDPDGGESLIESSELDSDGNQVRIFVGIYDYIPSVMSPNPDAALKELPFSEGQLLKVGQLVLCFIYQVSGSHRKRIRILRILRILINSQISSNFETPDEFFLENSCFFQTHWIFGLFLNYTHWIIAIKTVVFSKQLLGCCCLRVFLKNAVSM